MKRRFYVAVPARAHGGQRDYLAGPMEEQSATEYAERIQYAKEPFCTVLQLREDIDSATVWADDPETVENLI